MWKREWNRVHPRMTPFPLDPTTGWRHQPYIRPSRAVTKQSVMVSRLHRGVECWLLARIFKNSKAVRDVTGVQTLR